MKALLSLLALLLVAPFAAGAGQAHEHGIARLDVAVEPARVVILLDSPLENLVGIEREPRTDTEKARADAMLARLRQGAVLFRIDPAAGCTLTRVELQSPALGLGPARAKADAGHADLEAMFEFACPRATSAGFIDTAMFDAFPRLQRLKVQMVTGRGQSEATLRRPASRLTLLR
jgi:hypothetical protein